MSKDEVCHEHSGCLSDIANLKKSDSSQWEELRIMRDKVGNIMTRLNIVLGGIIVAIIIAMINLAMNNGLVK